MQTLNQDIKERSFRPVYLLYGEETFLVNSYKNRLKEAVLGDDTMNFSRYEGKGIDVSELIRQADTMPFFAEKGCGSACPLGRWNSCKRRAENYRPHNGSVFKHDGRGYGKYPDGAGKAHQLYYGKRGYYRR